MVPGLTPQRSARSLIFSSPPPAAARPAAAGRPALEAAALIGAPIAQTEPEMAEQGRALLALGPRAVLMKGGHLAGDEAVDFLVTAEGVRRFAAPRRASQNLHGTGCTLSSAIAAHIALGADLAEAVAAAKDFVSAAIERGRDVKLGEGPGPLIPIPLGAGRG